MPAGAHRFPAGAPGIGPGAGLRRAICHPYREALASRWSQRCRRSCRRRSPDRPPPTSTPTTSRTSRTRSRRSLGRPVPNKLSRELAEIPQASGADLIDGADPAVAPAFYGYDFTDAAHPLIAIPPATAEAQKTEPDKNTYLVLSGQKGADPAFDYGTHFVFQGHEAGRARLHHARSTSTPTATTA